VSLILVEIGFPKLCVLIICMVGQMGESMDSFVSRKLLFAGK
jgi:hypothetical protein